MKKTIKFSLLALVLYLVISPLYFRLAMKPVDESVNNNYYYVGQKVFYSPLGNWLELGFDRVDGVKKKGFTVFDSYGTFENTVYFGPNEVVGSDAKSFNKLDADFPVARDAYNIYTYSSSENTLVKDIRFDVESTEVLASKLHVKDKMGVYFFAYDRGLIKYAGADPESFEILFQSEGYYDNLYAKDKDNVYFELEKIEEADPKSFSVVLGESPYAEDVNNVYYKGRVIGDSSSDLKVFGSGYAANSKYIFNYGNVMEGGTPATFLELSGSYFADDTYVYYRDRKVEGANPQTFEVLSEHCGKDNKNYYSYSDLSKEDCTDKNGSMAF